MRFFPPPFRTIFSLTLCLLAPGFVRAKVTAGFRFLNVSPFADHAALGEAVVAGGTGASAVWSNPAGLAETDRSEAALGHLQLYEDVNHEAASMVRIRSWGGWGVWGGIHQVDGIQKTVPVDTSVAPEGFVSAGKVRVGGQYAGFAWGVRPRPGASWGVGLSYAREELDTLSAQTLMASVGALLEITPEWKVGAALLNAGPSATLGTARVAAPARFRLGALRRPREYEDISYEADAGITAEGHVELLGGVAVEYAEGFFLRLGYRYLSGRQAGTWSGIGGGLGAAVGAVVVDYAYVAQGDLGGSHFFRLGWRFGPERGGSLRLPRRRPSRTLPAGKTPNPGLPVR
jgi:hypothetical protein